MTQDVGVSQPKGLVGISASRDVQFHLVMLRAWNFGSVCPGLFIIHPVTVGIQEELHVVANRRVAKEPVELPEVQIVRVPEVR